MSTENEFIFTKQEMFKSKLGFNVSTEEETVEIDVYIENAEDLVDYMGYFINKDWETLFKSYNKATQQWYKEITEVEFDGLYVVAKEAEKGHIYYRLNDSQTMTVNVDAKQLGDENSRKIQEIRQIIGH